MHLSRKSILPSSSLKSTVIQRELDCKSFLRPNVVFLCSSFPRPNKTMFSSGLKIKVKIKAKMPTFEARQGVICDCKTNNLMQLFVISSPAVSRQVTSLRSNEVVSPQLRHSTQVHGQAQACYDIAGDKQTCSIDQTNRA